MAAEGLIVGMGGGVVRGEVGICAGGQLRGVAQRAGGTAFRVVSVVVGVLSCGSRFTSGVSVRSYLLDCWIPRFISEKLPGVDCPRFRLLYEAS